MRNSQLVICLITLVFLVSHSSTCIYALNLYQVTTINNDGSGKIKLSYWDSKSKIKDAPLYNSLPFTEDKIRQIFASDNNNVANISVSKTNPETIYVNVEIAFKDIQKINTAQGFSKIKTTWYITADSTTLMYQFDKNEEFANITSAIYSFELPTKEILRSSGSKKNDNFFSVKVDPESFLKGTTVFAVFKNSTGNSASDQTNEKENKNQVVENDKKETKKGCGIFSVELPIVIGVGLWFVKMKNRTKTKKHSV